MESRNNISFNLSRWISFTFLGWFLGIVLILVLSSTLDTLGVEDLQFFLGLGMGCGIGFAQWIRLKKYPGISIKWVWYTIIGLGVPFLFFDLLSQFEIFSLRDFYIPVCVLFSGLMTGWLQGILLKHHIPNPSSWILISLLGWAVAALTIVGVEYTKFLSDNNWVLFSLNLLLLLSGGPILGYITGRFLVRKLKP